MFSYLFSRWEVDDDVLVERPFCQIILWFAIEKLTDAVVTEGDEIDAAAVSDAVVEVERGLSKSCKRLSPSDETYENTS